MLVAFIGWRHHARVDAIDAVPIGALVLGGGYAIYKSLSNTNEVMNFASRFGSIFQVEEGSGLTRTEIWHAAVSAILSSPMRFIFGFGADTFRLVFPKYKPLAYTHDAGYLSVADNVHDYPLQLAAGVGVIGFLLLYGVFVWAAVRSFKTVFGKSTDVTRLIVGGFWCAAAAYIVQLMFGLSVTGNTFLLWVCIGVVLAPTATFVEFEAPNWGVAAAAIGIVLAVAGIAYQFVFMAADYQYLLAQTTLTGSDATHAAILAEKLNPWNDMYKSEIAMAYRQEIVDLANQAYTAQQQGQTTSQYPPLIQAKLEAAVSALKETIKFVPTEYDNYVFIASVYNMGGALLTPQYYKDAEYWAQKGIEVEPYGPAVRVEYARALIGLGNQAQAIKVLQAAYAMDNAYVDGGELLAQELEAAGRNAEAIKVLQTLQAANPTDTTVAPLIKQYEASSTTPAATTK